LRNAYTRRRRRCSDCRSMRARSIARQNWCSSAIWSAPPLLSAVSIVPRSKEQTSSGLQAYIDRYCRFWDGPGRNRANPSMRSRGSCASTRVLTFFLSTHASLTNSSRNRWIIIAHNNKTVFCISIYQILKTDLMNKKVAAYAWLLAGLCASNTGKENKKVESQLRFFSCNSSCT
jgi:hypothetical protein